MLQLLTLPVILTVVFMRVMLFIVYFMGIIAAAAIKGLMGMFKN